MGWVSTFELNGYTYRVPKNFTERVKKDGLNCGHPDHPGAHPFNQCKPFYREYCRGNSPDCAGCVAHWTQGGDGYKMFRRKQRLEEIKMKEID